MKQTYINKVINIDKEEYILRYVSEIIDGYVKDEMYLPLVKALFRRLSPTQKEYLIIKTKDAKIIMHQELLDCYQRKDTPCYFSDCRCICNVPIKQVFTIKNLETKKKYKIGCDCIINWGFDKKIRNLIKVAKCIRDNKDTPIFCSFCNKLNSTNRNCKCNEKSIVKNVFDAWKLEKEKHKANFQELLQKKMDFSKDHYGKYLIEVCKNIGFIKWLRNTLLHKEDNRLHVDRTLKNIFEIVDDDVYYKKINNFVII